MDVEVLDLCDSRLNGMLTRLFPFSMAVLLVVKGFLCKWHSMTKEIKAQVWRLIVKCIGEPYQVVLFRVAIFVLFLPFRERKMPGLSRGLFASGEGP